jgi:hypothetical protein
MPLPSWIKRSHSKFLVSLLSFAICVGLPPLSFAAQVSPSILSFSATQGGASPPPQTVGSSKLGQKQKEWTARADMPWIKVSPAAGEHRHRDRHDRH